jgi:hypothetical protein
LVLPGLRSVVVGLVIAATQLAAAQAKHDDGQQQRLKELIAALASPNRQPNSTGDDEVRIPFTYGRRTQQKVLDAWSALLKEGIDAFPLLVASVSDHRYSCTVRGGNGDINATVGEVCHMILRNHIEVYWDVIDYPWPGAEPRPYVPWERLPKWWQKRQRRTLRELQIEAAEYAIQALKNPSDHEVRLRNERPDVKTRQAANIQKVEGLLKRLRASDRPVEPRSIEGSWKRMIGLPGDKDDLGWRGRAHPFDGKEGAANTR